MVVGGVGAEERVQARWAEAAKPGKGYERRGSLRVIV